VLFAPRDIRIDAIHRGGRSEDELLDALVFGKFEQVLGRDNIGSLITDWVFNGGAHARFGGEVDDGVKGGGFGGRSLWRAEPLEG